MNSVESIYLKSMESSELISPKKIYQVYDSAHLRGIDLFANLIRVRAGVNLVFGQALERTDIRSNGSGIYLEAHGRMFGLENEPLGHYDGVMEPNRPIDPKEILKPPQAPAGSFDKPGLIPQIPILGRNRVDFIFNEMDSVTVAGQGAAHMARRRDGSNVFMVTAMNLITGGTGCYEGATGIQAATATSIMTGDMALVAGTTLCFITFYSLQIALHSLQDEEKE